MIICAKIHIYMLLQVDWTPELHRRFVKAVEQLGIDKAVPSRILEIMGIECLTRHNIASHLQVRIYVHPLSIKKKTMSASSSPGSSNLSYVLLVCN